MRELLLGALIVVTQLLGTSCVELKVGLYNEIPDLDDDELSSYKKMVEDGFNSGDHVLDAVVNSSEYSPYAEDLSQYLTADGFDLIELDVATLDGLVPNLVIPVPTNLPALSAAKDAVTVDGKVYGYPTLVCGNFIVGLSPGKCPLNFIASSYIPFYYGLEACQYFLHSSYQRIFGGKMNSESGWYLPYLYIDGYIDVHGKSSAQTAVDDVVNSGKIDETVCERLSWLINTCRGESQSNKCYENFEGSYVNSSKNVYTDIANEETLFFFGFSEITAAVMQKADGVSPYAAISPPLGEENNLLQFTDALVINKARWDAASEERKNAIKEFINYFTGVELRRKIAYGKDLKPPRNRYLLQAIEEFYIGNDDNIYGDIYEYLKRAVPAPSLSEEQKSTMQKVLSEKCIKFAAVKEKTEL